MNKLLAVALALLFAQSLSAQSIDRQVIGSAGMAGSTGDVEVLATVGEAVTETFSSGDFQITQGFQQPDMDIVATASPKINIAFSIFPNPIATGELVIEISPEKEVWLGLSLFSADGKLTRELEKPALYLSGKTRKSFNINGLAAGGYQLVATGANGQMVKALAVFKI